MFTPWGSVGRRTCLSQTRRLNFTAFVLCREAFLRSADATFPLPSMMPPTSAMVGLLQGGSLCWKLTLRVTAWKKQTSIYKDSLRVESFEAGFCNVQLCNVSSRLRDARHVPRLSRE